VKEKEDGNEDEESRYSPSKVRGKANSLKEKHLISLS